MISDKIQWYHNESITACKMLLVACRMRLAACICGLHYEPDLQEPQGYAYTEVCRSRQATHTQIDNVQEPHGYTYTDQLVQNQICRSRKLHIHRNIICRGRMATHTQISARTARFQKHRLICCKQRTSTWDVIYRGLFSRRLSCLADIYIPPRTRAVLYVRDAVLGTNINFPIVKYILQARKLINYLRAAPMYILNMISIV